MKAEMYPIDPDSLKKGQYISPEECTRIFGFGPDHPKYWQELLQLRKFIMDNTSLSVRTDHDGVRINTDAEASLYHDRWVNRGGEIIHRHHEHMIRRVDPGQLTMSEQRQYEHKLMLQAQLILRMDSGRVRCKQCGHEGEMQRLPPPSDDGADEGTGDDDPRDDHPGEAAA